MAKEKKAYTEKVSLKQIFDGSLTPPVRKSQTTKENEHLFKTKSFKPTQKTIMAHALEFSKWQQTTWYFWTGKFWKEATSGKEISEVQLYKKFLAESK